MSQFKIPVQLHPEVKPFETGRAMPVAGPYVIECQDAKPPGEGQHAILLVSKVVEAPLAKAELGSSVWTYVNLPHDAQTKEGKEGSEGALKQALIGFGNNAAGVAAATAANVENTHFEGKRAKVWFWPQDEEKGTKSDTLYLTEEQWQEALKGTFKARPPKKAKDAAKDDTRGTAQVTPANIPPANVAAGFGNNGAAQAQVATPSTSQQLANVGF